MNLPSFQLRRRTGAPILVGARALVPESLTLVVKWLGMGYVWNWPTAVLVVQDGHTQRLPIVDVTRWVQIGLWLLAGLAGLALLRTTVSQKGELP